MRTKVENCFKASFPFKFVYNVYLVKYYNVILQINSATKAEIITFDFILVLFFFSVTDDDSKQ